MKCASNLLLPIAFPLIALFAMTLVAAIGTPAMLGSLEGERSVLERTVEDLRSFERDYRIRLRGFIEGQLQTLDSREGLATSGVGLEKADS